MGYTDGKSESDVLIEEGDIDEDFGQIQVMKVTNHAHMYIFPFHLTYMYLCIHYWLVVVYPMQCV